jgi:predicted DNA-binding protein
MADKENKSANVSFRCPPGLAERLEDAKWTLRKSKGQILIEALEKHLNQIEKKKK